MIIKKVLSRIRTNHAMRVNEMVNYITSSENDAGEMKCLRHEALNFLSGNFAAQKREMRALLDAHKNRARVREDLVQHWTMSWGSGEMPSTDEVMNAAKRFLQEMGLGDYQTFIGVHLDTENIHVHMVFSRIHPDTHKCHNDFWHIPRAHAVMAGIEAAMRAEPNRNALFAWNAYQGAYVRKKRDRAKRRSKTFAYASPETLVLDMKGQEPDLSCMRRKGDCWYFRDSPMKQAGAILHEGRLYVMNWAYKDVLEDVKNMARAGVTVHAQKDLSFVFKDTPNVVFRERPVTFPIQYHEKRQQQLPWNYYVKIKRRYENKDIPPLRLRNYTALHMRLHSFSRRDITECLLRDGMEPAHARHVVRWLYSPKGTMELFRQCAQKVIRPDPPGSLKKPLQVKKKSQRLHYDPFGNLIYGATPKRDHTQEILRLEQKKFAEGIDVTSQGTALRMR